MTASPLSRVLVAPMAGGASTAELVAAAADSGALGFLAAGYRSAEDLEREILRTRSLSDGAFGVNIFVPWVAAQELGEAQLRDRRARIQRYAEHIGADSSVIREADTDQWEAKLSVLERTAPDWVSFTFGLPETAVVDRLHAAGVGLIATVTSLAEARLAAAIGVDALSVQGPEAGGHRGTHDQLGVPGTTALPTLVREIATLGLPVIAAGGISRAEDVDAVLSAGAFGVQCGTLFLRSPEAGTSPPYRQALAEGRVDTVLTRAFSGRWARGLENAFTLRGASAPAGYPEINQLTRPLRLEAAAAGDAQALSLWAGTGYRAATEEPAGIIASRLLRWVAQWQQLNPR